MAGRTTLRGCGEKWGYSSVMGQENVESDANLRGANLKKSYFKFEQWWMQVEGFREKSQLETKEGRDNQIAGLEKVQEQRILTDDELLQKVHLSREFDEASRNEEIAWRQRSRIQWLKHGDKNTKYFHRMATAHKRINSIEKLEVNGRELTDTDEIKTEITNFYQKLYRETENWRLGLNLQGIESISLEENDWLQRQFEEEEVAEGIKLCASDKYGFPMSFYQNFWEMLKVDIMNTIRQFHDQQDSLMSEQGWNFSFRRLLNDWEIGRVAEMLQTLDDFKGTNLEVDVMIWKHNHDGMLSVSRLYNRKVKELPGEISGPWSKVLGGFDASNYVTERQWATASDGTQIPISIIYQKNLVKLDSSDPLLLYGYGSYEICIDPTFKASRFSLLDRGFIYTIAHIRGGGEMGRQWYENGKLLKKKNTFTDFIACAEYLIDKKYCSKEKLCINGRSAGGLLIGAVVNMRPNLFKAAVAGVPFVDVVTTMLDPTIPLTTSEWEEWGDPRQEEFYSYMKSYSPVDNVKAQNYPDILVTAGLNDPRVMYSEPAKFVAKLRDMKTNDNLLLFKCEMGAGHFSKSGSPPDAGKDNPPSVFVFLLQNQLPPN
ncbi:hypothetical protein MTR67_006980 [Solanum verrucosum]|uniref:Prolyl endopeptidase n=1 Tax=Solanum verrucosum TaxID=315347 RepID=A0AAF0Q169_SOLVR|nr:hypothetical protein MTR67_006980 [Solanum verrucosum]